MKQKRSLHPENIIAYRVNDAALAAGLGRTTITELIASGELKSVKAAGRRLILRKDLLEYLESNRS